jgi:Xaa-Pro aminopeptidase
VQAIKSPAEIEKIRHMCRLASDCFVRLPGQMTIGMTERQAVKRLQADLLASGADATRYIAAASGPGAYDNIIMGPTDRSMRAGDVLVIDTGTTFDGYFCDFDRNFAFGRVEPATARAYAALYAATDAGIAAAVPGNRACDVFEAMWSSLASAGYADSPSDVGRMGHGLGAQLTEWPSLMPGDETVLEPGMVLAIEPGVSMGPKQCMVHEEDVLVREEGQCAELLTTRAAPEIPIVS